MDFMLHVEKLGITQQIRLFQITKKKLTSLRTISIYEVLSVLPLVLKDLEFESHVMVSTSLYLPSEQIRLIFGWPTKDTDGVYAMNFVHR